MKQTSLDIPVSIFSETDILALPDAALLQSARKATLHAYAPYSNFRVGVAVLLENGEVVTGSNQENASYPAGLCAERVALSAASSLFPGIAVTDLALSYKNDSGSSNHPISPCGICRQTLAEYEQRSGHSIRLLLGGETGEVYIIRRATDLLPFAFTRQELIPE